MIPLICFVVSDAGPAEHFAAFIEELASDHRIEIWASAVAAPKFREKQLHKIIDFDEAAANRIADSCKEATYVMTDLGHPFAILVQKALQERQPNLQRIAYYDNPELEVPGHYLQIANQVMALSNKVLIANADIAANEPMGIGYYPIHKARKINGLRQDQQDKKRAEFFHTLGQKDQGQKICLYLGGNNTPFYEEAFPAFCNIAPKDPHFLFVFQPHPSSKTVKLPEEFILSQWSTEEILITADCVLYFQTSMAPLVAFAGIPIVQVGKKRYQDLLLRSGVAFASTTEELKEALELTKKRLYQPALVGFRQDWPDRLRRALKA